MLSLVLEGSLNKRNEGVSDHFDPHLTLMEVYSLHGKVPEMGEGEEFDLEGEVNETVAGWHHNVEAERKLR